MFDRITQACHEAGSYALSFGTMQPALVVRRLLAALAVLDPRAHHAITALAGEHGPVPSDALYDARSGWWDTEPAAAFIESLIGAINAAAPKGFACSWSGADRLELIPFDPPPSEGVGPDDSASPAPVSALRTRVNSGQR